MLYVCVHDMQLSDVSVSNAEAVWVYQGSVLHRKPAGLVGGDMLLTAAATATLQGAVCAPSYVLRICHFHHCITCSGVSLPFD
jgi:hypothetical protein